MRNLLAALVGLMLIHSASAQVIYEPVRYQYGEQNSFYYGGSDPSVLRSANAPVAGGGQFGRVHGYAFYSGTLRSFQEVTSEPVRVFTDAMPRTNAAIYGYSPNDARNEAYGNMPRYFRMRDLLSHAVMDESGALHVPAQLPQTSRGEIMIKPYVHPQPGAMPKPLMIIPKELLQQRLAAPPQQPVASAQ